MYSKMRGTISLKELIDLAQSHQAGSLALTDVNTVRGFINFVHSAQDRNIAPIAGVNLITNIDEVVILAENHAGYEIMSNISGEKLDLKKHNFKIEIKSPTFHLMEIKENDEITMQYLLDL